MAVLLWMAAMLLGCTILTEPDAPNDRGGDTGVDPGGDSGTDTATGTDSGGDMDGDTDADADLDGDSDTDSDSDGDGGTAVDGGAVDGGEEEDGGPDPAVVIDPWDPLLEYFGRYADDDLDGPRFEWTGFTIRARFEGSAVRVSLGPDSYHYFNVIVDDREPIVVPPGDAAEHLVEAATGLAGGPHSLTVILRSGTSTWSGNTLQFLGLELPEGGALLPPAAIEKKIVFIGDSITVGYCNETDDVGDDPTAANGNNYHAFGAITARAFDAEYVCLAASGRGVWRNYSGSTDETMVDLVQRTLPSDPVSVWDWEERSADAVVINLGTNDFAQGDPGASFTARYRELVDEVRQRFLDAAIFCTLGPMLSGEDLVTARGYVEGVVGALNGEGDDDVHYLEFATLAGNGEYACDYHPSLAAHQRMAGELTAAMENQLGWDAQ